VSINSFTVNIGPTMAAFKPLTQFATKGATTLQVGVILPDTTSSTRYVNFDAPYLNAAFADAGYTQAQYRIDNAQGSDQTQLNDATADINLGAKVLIVDPLDGPTGQAIAQLAQSKGVTLIAYDRAIFAGKKTYYVSFDNEHVGELIGTGFMSCVSAARTPTPTPSPLPRVTTRWSGPSRPRQSARARPTAPASSWLARTSPLVGTTPRAAPSSSRRTPLTSRSTPLSRPMTGSPTR
jgi:hypothetical protein